MAVARTTLAAIHIAKKELGLDDDTYRAVLLRVAHVRSAADLDDAGARRVMAEFDRQGFAGSSKRDRRPLVRKAQALWIGLYNLDEVTNRDDHALDAFAKRITGKDTLKFATNVEAGKVVEALKQWQTRVGVKLPRGNDVGAALYALVQEQLRRLEGAGQSPVAMPAILIVTSLMTLANETGTEVRRLKLGSRNSPHQAKETDDE